MTVYSPQPEKNEVGAIIKPKEQKDSYAQAPPAYQPNAYPQGMLLLFFNQRRKKKGGGGGGGGGGSLAA